MRWGSTDGDGRQGAATSACCDCGVIVKMRFYFICIFQNALQDTKTNMLFVTLAPHIDANLLAKHCRAEGILISPGRTLRLVTHKDVSRQDIDKVLRVVKQYLKA